MQAQPGLQILTAGGLNVEQATGPKDGDEHLRFPDLARLGVDHWHRVAAEVDEETVTSPVLEPHDQILGAQPVPVSDTELRVAQAVGMHLPVFEPQQLLGHVLALQLSMDFPPVRLGPHLRRLLDAREQPGL